MEKMDIVAVTAVGNAEVLQIEKPKPQENQVLVRILGCGMCTFEQRVYRGISKMKLPFVGGHEIIGRIDAIGPNVNESEYPLGQKVVARTMKACGECYYCRHGQPNMCINKSNKFKSEKIQPAGLGQYITLDTAQIFKIAENIPNERAVITEPLACVVNSIERGNIHLGDDVVILGAGIMGALHILCAKLKGARVIVSEPDQYRAAISKKIGADIVLNPTQTDIVDEIKKITGRGADVVFDTLAIPDVAKQAMEITAPLGKCIMYSSMHPDEPVEIKPGWVHNTQVTITGAVSPSIESFATAVDLINKGLIKTELFVSSKISYKRTNEAFEAAIRPDTYRVMMVFDENEIEIDQNGRKN
ncbi:zinc-binding dehydrogenase [[Clostridium] innocuum]|nr:zinc-binding dehydrogenase [Erysipelotrichaceae bacterium]MCR0382844.1 zinc-binding dehydrogenase [[Clostridium] innocuum]MCR0412140.1 zinc-binding dehydrogenase [[Clostridium] innocuum]MCR0535059.1 zinc-binding dehydrogenase [[Clostridium] innocuum]MCR0537733.1 zinc-binding dehydrogenase [[Clostridium] innocuum]